MLFFSYFKDLVGREVTVELKNDLAIRGTLHSVDQYLNIKLENTRVVDQDKSTLKFQSCFGYFKFMLNVKAKRTYYSDILLHLHLNTVGQEIEMVITFVDCWKLGTFRKKLLHQRVGSEICAIASRRGGH
ncbi:Sm protein LSM2 [Spatholobus suberectus]|nr:Sm protein LSM2 [Spatholobus suberectus]